MTLFSIEHVRPLGEGGLGTVDVVHVTSDGGPYLRGSQFARKRLGAQWKNDPDARARFEREIALLQQMNHPAIVKFMGESVPGVERGYLMPLYPRSTRRMLTDHGGPIARWWVVDFGIKVAAALQYAHDQNFIHRDLKPENILLGFANEPVIADWGLGQFIHQQSKVLDLKTVGPVGTPYYAPFEQWSTGRCNPPGDVYSLGLILAEMVLGRRLDIMPPFTGIQQDIVANDSPAANMFNATIRKMTSLLETQRHASMNEVILALKQCC